MAYTAKKYSRINWKNRPSTATALGATNMNHMDVFLNDVDNALVEMEAAKLNIATANSMLKSVTYNKSTGVWNFQQLDGTSFTFDQNIEKIPVSFSLSESGVLTMTTEDGTQWECNVADLIKDYVFDDSETIGFSKEFKINEYHVSAIVKEGSIESKHLNPDYRADIQSYMNTAQTAANDSLTYSKDSKRWAVGDASYSGSETDNSKYYKEQAESAKVAAEKARDEAQAATGTKIMTPTEMGVGRPDGSTIGVTDGIFGLIAKAINLPAVDTSGIVGTAGEESTTQALLDELANRVVSKLVTNDALTTKLAEYMTKSMMSGTQVNDANHVPTSALAYSMNQAIETLNSNLSKKNPPYAEKTSGVSYGLPDYSYVLGSEGNKKGTASGDVYYIAVDAKGRLYGGAQVNNATDITWKETAEKDYLGVTQYNGVDYISLSGKLSNIGEWVKNNGTPGKCTFVRVEPSDSDGYFGTSGFSILWTRTSVNYGWCILISDNPKMVVFGRNTVGWNWYAPTLTQVS